MDLESQILNYSDTSFDNSHFDSEELHCTPADLMIHNFLEAPKIMDYENTYIFYCPNQHFHPLSLYKNKHLEGLNF